jgi:nicotinamidase-related amidase
MPSHPDLIDREDFVLIVVDVQEKLVASMDRRESVIAAVVRLVKAAALIGAPIVVTRQYPAGLGDTAAQVTGALSEAGEKVAVAVIDKLSFCACDEPSFLLALEATGRRQAVIAGMETHICVVQTALALTAHGFRVQVVEDACCSRRERDHATALARLRTQRVTVTSAESVMYEAAGFAGSDEFRRLLQIVKHG